MSELILCLICAVPEQHVLIMTRFGKFHRLQRAGAGIQCYNCFFEQPFATVSLLLQTLTVNASTKTRDHTFMSIQLDIQYRRLGDDEGIYKSVFLLDNPLAQMSAYVEDVVRTSINKLTLDEVYRAKTEISDTVKDSLQNIMSGFGYEIVACPVTELNPEDGRILKAMDQVLELERKLDAQNQANERIKNQILLGAEAEKVAFTESGKGLAAKRSAIVDGLRESVASFSKGMSEVSSMDVLELILMTQYFDMLKDVGSTGNNTVFVNHGPNAISNITEDIRKGFVVANANHN
jgi:regulator of protease activity HflC (stomatin/prohibitin superfamily)